MISVVIATLNRADALRDVSLPSLMRQRSGHFEIIVWDASDCDDSRKVCESFAEEFDKKGALLRYFKAPRRGSASQRNDAADSASGDIVFFIDDDCEAPIDGLASLSACFESYDWLMGAGLPWINLSPASGNSAIKKMAVRMFWMRNNCFQRVISKSGGLSLPLKDLAGTAEWLSGGSMAYRREVFDRLKLDERLQTFGGYALGEDVDFSHRVVLEFGKPLMVTGNNPVIHHAAKGGRISGPDQAAAHFFNPALIRGNFKRYGKRFNFFCVLWGTIGTILLLLYTGCSFADMVRGIKMASRAMKKISRVKKGSI
jgi:glycosyltransferase involved in cell wall biosynthesis